MQRVGIVCDRRVFDGMAVHQANDEYVAAVRDGAGAIPLLIPSTGMPLDSADLLAAVDGLLFTGAPSNVPRDLEYRPAHPVVLVPDGVLAELSGMRDAMVNSLHHQGVDRLAPGLKAEAHAPDGQIEAVSLPGAKAFLLGVQWHPEWAFAQDPLSAAIFRAFGASL